MLRDSELLMLSSNSNSPTPLPSVSQFTLLQSFFDKVFFFFLTSKYFIHIQVHKSKMKQSGFKKSM